MFSFSRIREAVESGSDNDEEFNNVDHHPNQEKDENSGCESRIGFDDGDINDFIEDVTESVTAQKAGAGGDKVLR